MMDGAYLADATGVRIVVGVERHPDRGRLERTATTGVHAAICGSCGFTEFYANRPEELHRAYRQAERKTSS